MCLTDVCTDVPSLCMIKEGMAEDSPNLIWVPNTIPFLTEPGIPMV